MNIADAKARLADIWAHTLEDVDPRVWPQITLVHDPARPAPAGHVLVRVARPPGDDRPVVAAVMPALTDDAPEDFQLRWTAAVIATAVGRCPICRGAAGLNVEPPGPGEPRALWHLVDVHVTVRHASGCPAAIVRPEERRYLVPNDDSPDVSL